MTTALPPLQSSIISCLTCSISHSLPEEALQRIASAQGFSDRHRGHNLTFGRIASPGLHAQYGVAWNSDIKLALQAIQTMTVTSLHSLANSATGGWQSNVVDNTSNLFLDAWLQVVLDFANTAPANSKAAFVFAYGGIETGKYSNPASGSEGTITLVDIDTTPQNMKLVGNIPYTTADEVVESSPMSVAAAFSGMLPPYWGVALMNRSGAALAGSGNTVKYMGIYATVL